MTARIEVRNVTKTFPGVRALDDVTVLVAPGEIHALLGENGAGKSTIGKIIGGIYSPDSGHVYLDGAPLGTISEAQANRLGIGVVHQEGSLVQQLSVGENIFAGRQPTGRFGQIDRKLMRETSRAILQQLGVSIDPDLKIARLSPAQGQVVEIAKALSHDLKVLILDEPTAALTMAETEALFSVTKRLAASGVAVIYVSHRLAEIFELCDRVTVLKDGRNAGTLEVAKTDTEELIRLMVGRELHFSRDDNKRTPGEVLIDARNVSGGSTVNDASVVVRAGEIVCLAGLVGSGRTEFCEVLFGARRRDGGEIRFLGKAWRPNLPKDAIKGGMGMVCEDRKDGGLFLDLGIADNIAVTVLESVSSGLRISNEKMKDLADRFIDRLAIATPSARQIVGNLSGGNQQKVLLAKWLAVSPKLLIVDEPTRGVDVGARSEIYRILRELAADGVGLLVVSSDLPEVLTLADRIVVMADGRTVSEIDGASADEVSVLRHATSQTAQQAASPQYT